MDQNQSQQLEQNQAISNSPSANFKILLYQIAIDKIFLNGSANASLLNSQAHFKQSPSEQVHPSFQQRFRDRLSQSSVALFFGSSLAGIARAFIGLSPKMLIGFPIEHPLDSIKTQWQAKPYLKNEFALKIYTKTKESGEYMRIYYISYVLNAGASANIARSLLKNATRYPLMVALPGFYKDHLPLSVREHQVLLKFLTGCSIALFEASLACPIERLKMDFTNQQFFAQYKDNLAKELFRGFGPLLARQIMVWSVFLQSDLLVRTTIRRIIVALVNTTLVMPFDCVKTHMEKRDPSNTYINSFRTIYRQGGALAFFTGYRIRFFMYFINSLIS